jgi:selenocysteine lyase/cysteine desulfurase
MSHSDPAVPDELLQRWRSDTPGTAERVHLNNAGAALTPRPVQAAILDHLALEASVGAYEAADLRAPALAAAYASLGRILGTEGRNVAIVQNSTVAFAQALSAFDFAPGDVILTTRADYVSNQIMYLSLARRCGVEVVRADDLAEGGVDPESVRREIARRRPRLVALTWVPTNSGLVQDARAVGEICELAGVPYLVDACQAVGQMPVDVHRLRCDYLAATTRKFLRGPRGIGLLYVSDRALDGGAHPLLPDMRGADWTATDEFALAPGARRFETWEFAYALVLGAGAAAAYALEVGLDTAQRRSRALAALARERLAALPGVRVLDRGPELCAIATAAIEGHDGDAVKLALRAAGINTSAIDRGSALIDMDAKGVSSGIRVSPHYYNTEAEVERMADALGQILRPTT